MLVAAAEQGVRRLLLFGYQGKLIKLAGGIFHTHHHLADGRREVLTALGALQGLAGGLVALAVVWGSLAALNVGVAELATSYGSGFRLAFLNPGDALASVAFSGLLGWFGAYLSVSRYLLEIEPS